MSDEGYPKVVITPMIDCGVHMWRVSLHESQYGPVNKWITGTQGGARRLGARKLKALKRNLDHLNQKEEVLR